MPRKSFRPFVISIVCLTTLALFAVSCASPAPAVAPIVTPPNTVGEAAKQTLKNLPTIKMTLPKSLSATSSTAKSLMDFRALGDTTNLTTVPSLKSQAWYNLQGNGGNSFLSFINKAFGLLRSYADANEIKDGAAFDLPVTDDNLVQLFGMPDNMRGQVKVATKILVSGAAVDDFSINVNVDMSMTMYGNTANFSAHTRIDVTGLDTNQKLKMYFLVDQTMNSSSGTSTMKFPLYAFYDAATGACDMVQQMSYGSTVTDSIQRTIVGTDGSITNVNVYKSSEGNNNSVYAAYGDDVAGGIASLYSYSYTDYNNATVNRDSYWGEYYGTDGNLLLRSNGDTNLWVPVWTDSQAVNLKAAPFNYPTAPVNPKQRSSWTSNPYDPETHISSGVSTNEVLAFDGVTWVPVSRYNWSYNGNTQASTYSNEYYDFTTSQWVTTTNWGSSLVFKASVGPNAPWQAGDTVYYQKDSTSAQVGETYYWVQTMYAGYIVPASVNKFGKEYFVTKEYPLDAILPLKASYATNYRLIQEEGETYTWDWTDWEGKSQTSNWTSYSYYLNHDKTGENPIRMDTADGDINLNDKLSSYDMYYWHDGTSDKVKGYFLQTTGDVPPYFTQPSASLIDRVDNKLDQALTEANALSAASFVNELNTSRNDPTKGVF